MLQMAYQPGTCAQRCRATRIRRYSARVNECHLHLDTNPAPSEAAQCSGAVDTRNSRGNKQVAQQASELKLIAGEPVTTERKNFVEINGVDRVKTVTTSPPAHHDVRDIALTTTSATVTSADQVGNKAADEAGCHTGHQMCPSPDPRPTTAWSCSQDVLGVQYRLRS